MTAWGSARLLVNGVEVGRQGGFMPYERTTPRVRRYTRPQYSDRESRTPCRGGARPMPILVDGLVVSDHDWQAAVEGSSVPTVRRRPWHRALADLYLTRRPHPLPAAAWLDARHDRGRAVTFAVPRSSPDRIEHLRSTYRPVRPESRSTGRRGVLAIDGEQVVSGSARLPPRYLRRQGRLTDTVTTPGHEAGAALNGPSARP